MKNFAVKKNTARFYSVFCCLLIISLLLIGSELRAEEADPLTQKTELVYAKLDGSGAYEKLIVVNKFNLSEASEIQDYGAYSEIQSLQPEVEFLLAEGEVKASLPAGNWSYRGDLPEARLPWNIALSYTLNGEAILPEELSGASGRLGFSLHISANPELPAELREAYIMQFSLNLAQDQVKNLEAHDAIIANAGKNLVLTYVALPQEDKPVELKFTAEVEDFSMPAPNLAAIPLDFNWAALSESLNLPNLIEDFGQEFMGEGGPLEQLENALGGLKEQSATLNSEAKSLVQTVKALTETLDKLELQNEDEETVKALREHVEKLKTSFPAFSGEMGKFNFSLAFLDKGVRLQAESYAGKISETVLGLMNEKLPQYSPQSFVSPQNQTVKVQYLIFLPEVLKAEK